MSEADQAQLDALAYEGTREAAQTILTAVRCLFTYRGGYNDINGYRTTVAGWPARDALPTTDPEADE